MRGPQGSVNNRRTRLKGRLLAALGALLAAPAAALPADPPDVNPQTPALWAISDHDTTIFLFGTFHALDASTDWFSPTIRAALDASDQLVLETIVPSTPGELRGTLIRHQLLSEPVAGAPIIADGSAPGFVGSARRTMAASRELGMTVEMGADSVLRRTAEAQGKAVAGLESFDAQLGMFTTISRIAPSGGSNGQQLDHHATVDRLRIAWKAGVSSAFATMLGSMQSQSPETYRILFVDRNQRWADWIARRLDQPGVTFVAVGAGHLSGGDSVQVNLARRGIRSNRVG